MNPSLEQIRHSFSHIMAQAVMEIFQESNVKLAIGPVIENGFYYDFDLDRSITMDDLKKIKKAMIKIINKNLTFRKEEIRADDARKMFQEMGQDYKVELIDDLVAEGHNTVSLYYHGEWCDLCAGPHVDSTKELNPKAFSLDRVSGAYWRGDEKRPMLQRIYGYAFYTKDELNHFLKEREEALKRDHKKLGKELEIYMTHPLVGRGLPMLLPKGATIRRVLERFIVDQELKRGYSHVYTPDLGTVDLYKVSGHFDHYHESMFNPIEADNDQFVLRPMTCPHHFMIYKNKLHSYNDLPIRLAEISPLYRYEKSGELGGLIRIRRFTLADAHIVCTPDQVFDEFKGVCQLIQFVMKSLGVEERCTYRASIRGSDKSKSKYVANDEMWKRGEETLLKIIDELGLDYTVGEGEAAFYGPKLDVQIKNVHGKEDTIITNQIDFHLAEKFDLKYISHEGKEERPVIVHRSSLGCLERTIAFLLEHYGGALPLWLSPIQVRILSIADKHTEYCREIENKLRSNGLRCEVDLRNESLGKKIREGRLQRIPYLLIIGDSELQDRTVTSRNRDTGKQATLAFDEFFNKIMHNSENRDLALEI